MWVKPGHFKYSSANPEAWRSFCGAHGVPVSPPSYSCIILLMTLPPFTLDIFKTIEYRIFILSLFYMKIAWEPCAAKGTKSYSRHLSAFEQFYHFVPNQNSRQIG